MKAQRKVGAKVALAARVDSAGSSPDGAFGEEMVDKLEREFERLARPAPKKVIKALPRPDEDKKKRRGGKRSVVCIFGFLWPGAGWGPGGPFPLLLCCPLADVALLTHHTITPTHAHTRARKPPTQSPQSQGSVRDDRVAQVAEPDGVR